MEGSRVELTKNQVNFLPILLYSSLFSLNPNEPKKKYKWDWSMTFILNNERNKVIV